MTIIKRVCDSLRAHGNDAEADELAKHGALLLSSFNQLTALLRRKELTTQLLITTIQHRCPHHEWVFAWHPRVTAKQNNDPEEMSCYVCELTVKHPEVAKLAKSMANGGHYILARAGGRVTLPAHVRKAILPQFITKEQVNNAHEETLRAAGDGAGEGAAPGGTGEAAVVQQGATESKG